jgi:hypothetical protein
MKIIQLFKDGKEIIASDGIIYADGRLNLCSIYLLIKSIIPKRVNFPDKQPDSFAIYRSNSIRNGYGKIHKL